MKATTATILHQRFGAGTPTVTARAPGRVNLIGEHTDYNDGFVLPTLIDRWIEVTARRRPDDRLRLLAIDPDETVEHRLGRTPDPAWPGWAPYLIGLAEELRAQGLLTAGFDLALHGTVPQGAGLGSSAALEIAAALALTRAFACPLDPLTMVHLCRDVEHRWAGVRCGIMDQMACRFGRPASALLIDCRRLDHRPVPLPLAGHALVITDSGVRRRLGDSAYNQRRHECEQGVAHLRRHDPAVAALRDVTPAFLAAHRKDLPPDVAARCRHVVEENDRVLAAVAALERGDLPRLGALMTASHASLRDLYAASHPVLDRLVAAALTVPGVLGSRLTGAGFGGCTVTLCTTDAAASLCRLLRQECANLGVPGTCVPIGTPAAAAVLEDAS